MGNVFDKFRGYGGQPNIPNIISQFMQTKTNPSQIGQLLYNAGRITKEQLADIQQMTNPRQIGEYLMGHNNDFKNMVSSFPNKPR